MNVYVYLKICENPIPSGTTKGDVAYIYPMVEDQGKLTLNNFIPVVMDLNIPCGYPIPLLRCVFGACPHYALDKCDKLKFENQVWEIDEKETARVVRGRKYNLDWNIFISEDSKELTTNPDKTEIEKVEIFSRAVKYPRDKSELVDMDGN